MTVQLVQMHRYIQSITEVYSAYPAKRSCKLSKLSFDGMNVFRHQFDDINALVGTVSDKIFPCQL